MIKRVNERRVKRKYNKIHIILICVLVIYGISLTSILGRYVLNSANEFFSKSKEFYFNSDKLKVNGQSYQIENWAGVDDYVITVNLNSFENNLLAATYNIPYEITYTCSNNAICQLSKTQGTIYSSTNTDFFNMTITPNTALHTGDRVIVEVEAKAKSTYEKTLKGKFTLIVGQEQISYEIVDEANSPYLELNITNTLTYYTVNQSFDTHTVGERITIDTYLALSQANKAKCSSTIITLNFNPNDIVLDLTNSNYLNATTVTNTTKNSYNYINGITFKVDAISSATIRFYKMDESRNYTYPIINATPIITLTSV